jgi:alkyl hydroperoxide reductase subunit AhpC
MSKPRFDAAGYTIYGMSGDKPEKNHKFKEKQALRYSLLSDVNYALHTVFGIVKGSKGTVRSVLIITQEGRVLGYKKAGPDETVKYAREVCGISASDDKLDVAQESPDAKVKDEQIAVDKAQDYASKQPTVEEIRDANT